MALNDREIDKKNIYYDKVDRLTYSDVNSSDIILTILITLCFAFGSTLFMMLKYKNKIVSDWANERCKPLNVMFAGFYGKNGKDNFNYCLNQNYQEIEEVMMAPLNLSVKLIGESFYLVNEGIEDTRSVLSYLEDSISAIANTIMGYILSILIPFQPILSSFNDAFGKIQGILTTILFAVLGTYYTLKSLLGAILELSIDILIALIILIMFYYFFPIFVALATALMTLFIVLASLLSVTIFFMIDGLHMTTPGLPKI